jgi:hypothetical protein
MLLEKFDGDGRPLAQYLGTVATNAVNAQYGVPKGWADPISHPTTCHELRTA